VVSNQAETRPGAQSGSFDRLFVELYSLLTNSFTFQSPCRDNKTTQQSANVSRQKPHRQIEYQRRTGAPGPPVAPLDRMDYRTAQLSIRRPPARASICHCEYITFKNQRENQSQSSVIAPSSMVIGLLSSILARLHLIIFFNPRQIPMRMLQSTYTYIMY
jgi:hypothetical protein